MSCIWWPDDGLIVTIFYRPLAVELQIIAFWKRKNRELCICSSIFLKCASNFCFYVVGNCRKTEEQKPKEHKPKASENKPVMNEWKLDGKAFGMLLGSLNSRMITIKNLIWSEFGYYETCTRVFVRFPFHTLFQNFEWVCNG